LVKNPLVLAFGIIENGRSWLFSTKMGVVWPFIIDQRLIHLTPDMFPCHRSHSWISGGDHFLVKSPYVLAFGIIENGCSWLFSIKMGVVWPMIINQRLFSVLLKMAFMDSFDKNRGCVANDHQPEARKPHPTYVSLP
jgi:hypothetical protein